MLQVLLTLLHWMLQVIKPFLVPLCFVLAWTLTVLASLSVWNAIRASVANAKRMHQIPCANCRFFTGDYRLKCPVRPTIALSELAVNCSDYEPLP